MVDAKSPHKSPGIRRHAIQQFTDNWQRVHKSTNLSAASPREGWASVIVLALRAPPGRSPGGSAQDGSEGRGAVERPERLAGAKSELHRRRCRVIGVLALPGIRSTPPLSRRHGPADIRVRHCSRDGPRHAVEILEPRPRGPAGFRLHEPELPAASASRYASAHSVGDRAGGIARARSTGPRDPRAPAPAPGRDCLATGSPTPRRRRGTIVTPSPSTPSWACVRW